MAVCMVLRPERQAPSQPRTKPVSQDFVLIATLPPAGRAREGGLAFQTLGAARRAVDDLRRASFASNGAPFFAVLRAAAPPFATFTERTQRRATNGKSNRLDD